MSVPQFHSLPGGLGPKRSAILRVAMSKQGIVEDPIGSNGGARVNALLPAWVIKSPTREPWCCFSAFKVAEEALGAFPLGKWHGSCSRAWADALRQGVAVRNDGGRLPYPGDLFLVNGPDPDDPDDMRHIGVVHWVSADGTTINTQEGNCRHRWMCGQRSLTDGQIGGWIDTAPDEHPDSFERGLVAAPWTARSPTR